MDSRESTRFLRRALFLGILQIGLVLILVGRMYYLQVLQGPYYSLLAEKNRVATRPLIPLRGRLFDRKGVPFVDNEASFHIILLTDKRDEIEKTLDAVGVIIEITPEQREETLRLGKKARTLDSIVIKDKLTWDEVSALELHAADLPGVSVEVGTARNYPDRENAAHFTGYVSAPSEKEVEDDRGLDIPGIKVGKVGLEKYYDTRLRGTPGLRAFEVNARRKIVRELEKVPSQPGEDITLTLDKDLQNYVQEVLNLHPSGSAVVLEIETGNILALVSTPSFDPNLFPQGIGHLDWNSLRDNPFVPLTNKAISGLYAPGSTVKPFVALAALDAGVINDKTHFFCPGYIYIGNHKFHCWKKGGHGTINVSRAISESCDVFFYETSKRLGIEKLEALYKKVGLGEGGLPDFPYLKKGLVPSKEWKKARKHGKWTVTDTILTSIGQGYMLSSPLELAIAIARVASRGQRVVPRLEDTGPVTFEELDLNPDHLRLVMEAMSATTNVPGGTAYSSRILTPGLEMGGKTGTSQVRRITLEQRRAGQTKTTHLPWKYREHGLFIGYAPVEAPRYAVAVVIEHAGGGSPAAKVARDILTRIQLLDGGGEYSSPSPAAEL